MHELILNRQDKINHVSTNNYKIINSLLEFRFFDFFPEYFIFIDNKPITLLKYLIENVDMSNIDISKLDVNNDYFNKYFPDLSLPLVDAIGKKPIFDKLLGHPNIKIKDSFLVDWYTVKDKYYLYKLLEYPNIDVNIQINSNGTLIDNAILNDMKELFDKLLGHPNIKIKDSFLVNCYTVKDKYYLYKLLKHPNIDVNIQINSNGTLIDNAIKDNKKELFDKLLEHPNIDINKSSDLLFESYKKDDSHYFDKLLEHPKIDINKDGIDTILRRSYARNKTLFEKLIKRPDINLNIKINDEHLIHLLFNSSDDNFYIALDNPKIDINVLNYEGNSLLYMAIETKNIILFTKLLGKSNINVNIKNNGDIMPIKLILDNIIQIYDKIKQEFKRDTSQEEFKDNPSQQEYIYNYIKKYEDKYKELDIYIEFFIKLLETNKIDINAELDPSNNTLLHIILQKVSFINILILNKMIKTIFKYSDNMINVNAKNIKNNTPLQELLLNTDFFTEFYPKFEVDPLRVWRLYNYIISNKKWNCDNFNDFFKEHDISNNNNYQKIKKYILDKCKVEDSHKKYLKYKTKYIKLRAYAHEILLYK